MNHPMYNCWKANHKCHLNHSKSSGAMEGAGVVEIFSRSVNNYGVIYKYYLGDGDSSSFNDVINSKPYSKYGVELQKLECVGHIQKRVGNCLRERRKQNICGKKLTGVGNLTNSSINTIQNYFGDERNCKQ